MKRPFAFIGFTCAVTLLVLNIAGIKYTFAVGTAVLVLFIASLALPKYRKEMIFPLCFGSALFSCMIFICVYYSSVAPALLLDGKEALVSFYITDLPHKTASGYYTYTAKTKIIDLSGAVQNIKIQIRASRPLYADAYQNITASLKFKSSGENAFDSYGLWGRGIYLTANIDDYSVSQEISNRAGYALVNFRSDIINTLCKNVGGDAGAFSAALITGNRENLSGSAMDAFSGAGTLHLMAVSGLHLGVITGAAGAVLKLLRVKERAQSVIIIIFIFLFSALTGFSSSVVRAGIMMTVLYSGKLFKMRSDALNSLGIAVFIICLNPFAPGDAGAVLSVLAVLAILTASEAMKNGGETSFSKNKTGIFKEILKYIADGIFVSFCILLFSLPAVYAFFGYFSAIGVLINVFIIPLGGISAVLSIITFISDKIHILSFLFNYADRGLNNFILSLIKTAAEFSVSTVEMNTTFGFTLAFLLAAGAVCFFTGNKKAVKYSFGFSALAVVAMSVVSLI